MAKSEWDLPSLKYTLRLRQLNNKENEPFYDVKFWPFDGSVEDSVFAVVGGCYTIICRLREDDDQISIIRMFKDEDMVQLNSCAWGRDSQNGDPLICVSGKTFDKAGASIRILNVKTGESRDLVGHGGDVEDLMVSPFDPSILFSASLDYSIQAWNLDSARADNPHFLKCAGHGHREGVLSIALHHSGEYLLSGALDSAVCVWYLPELKRMKDTTSTIYHPHFYSNAIHSNYVDCVAFYGDLVLSRSAEENVIKLWRIRGFPSKEPPTVDSAPVKQSFAQTQSGFISPDSTDPAYEILLEFSTPNSPLFYMRFALFSGINHHDVLAFTANDSKILMWDLQSLTNGVTTEEGAATSAAATPGESAESSASSKKNKRTRPLLRLRPPKPIGRDVIPPEVRARRSNPHARTGITNAFAQVSSHKSIVVPTVGFTGRQAAWSTDGKWLVVVGDWGMTAVLRRW